MEDNLEITDFDIWCLFVENGDLLHAVGYNEQPSVYEISRLFDELIEDPELGLTSSEILDCEFYIVDSDEFEEIFYSQEEDDYDDFDSEE